MKGLGGGGALGFGQQVRLIVFQGHDPVQTQSLEGGYERGLHKGRRPPTRPESGAPGAGSTLQQGQRAGYLTLAVLLKADAEGDGKAAA